MYSIKEDAAIGLASLYSGTYAYLRLGNVAGKTADEGPPLEQRDVHSPNGGRVTVKTAPRRLPSNKSWP